MLVETFEQLEQTTDELGNVQMECDAEAMALAEKLGLVGQMELNSPKEITEAPVRFPYREMTSTELAVYGILCPDKSKLKAYRAGPIPLRVLQVAAHAEGMFKELEVWSVRTANVKDPVLVGLRDNQIETWRGPIRYMLARWGDVLEPLDELHKKAASTLRARKKSAAQVASAKLVAFLATIDIISDESVMSETNEPYLCHV